MTDGVGAVRNPVPISVIVDALEEIVLDNDNNFRLIRWHDVLLTDFQVYGNHKKELTLPLLWV